MSFTMTVEDVFVIPDRGAVPAAPDGACDAGSSAFIG